jgi:hypothetical protein
MNPAATSAPISNREEEKLDSMSAHRATPVR